MSGFSNRYVGIVKETTYGTDPGAGYVFGEVDVTTFEDVQDTIQVAGKFGYLRNMLINTKLIKEAFGVSNEDEFTVETINIIEAIVQKYT